MARTPKKSVQPKGISHNANALLIFVAVLSLLIVVMVLTRLYFVERDTVNLKNQVSDLIQKTELQNVSAPSYQDSFTNPFEMYQE